MIKDVMVRLDGTVADDQRLAAADRLARIFDGHVVGLFLNILPSPLPADLEVVVTNHSDMLRQARTTGDDIERSLSARLDQLRVPSELRRFDILAGHVATIATHEARSTDAFVASRPGNVPQEPEDMVESILFGSGRHVYIDSNGDRSRDDFGHVLVAWNGSREAARALAEAMPYLHKARTVTVCVVDQSPRDGLQAVQGADAGKHLERHGIPATVHHVAIGHGGVGATLMAEARRQKVDLMVIGAYGHSRFREWLLGGVTYELLHHAPIPLVLAH